MEPPGAAPSISAHSQMVGEVFRILPPAILLFATHAAYLRTERILAILPASITEEGKLPRSRSPRLDDWRTGAGSTKQTNEQNDSRVPESGRR